MYVQYMSLFFPLFLSSLKRIFLFLEGEKINGGKDTLMYVQIHVAFLSLVPFLFKTNFSFS